MTPEYIVERHVQCNVTGLVSELIECGSELGQKMMGQGGLSGSRDYEAYEVWIVSSWLAKRLRQRGFRVIECCYQCYWARGAAGQSIALDTAIKQIAEAERVERS